ncbi:hypothetical protein BACPU_25570 [Bacillus pumilus]|nr:hypothetical protein BACPU_25570 [Bacillus pumilus]
MDHMLKLTFSKSINYWHPLEGAGVNRDGESDHFSQFIDASNLNTTIDFDWTQNEISSLVVGYLEGFDFPTDSLILSEKWVSFNIIEDADAEILNEEQARMKHADGSQLYICDYSIYLEVLTSRAITEKELRNLFPDAEHL